jgi:hypothetical protein
MAAVAEAAFFAATFAAGDFEAGRAVDFVTLVAGAGDVDAFAVVFLLALMV